MRYQDLKVGMKVKIVSKVDDYHTDADGIEWDNVWVADMNNFIGDTFLVDRLAETGVYADNRDRSISIWAWPWEALEEVVEPTVESSPE